MTTASTVGALPYIPAAYDPPVPTDTATDGYTTPRFVHLQDGWIPQGQAYAGHGLLLTTYYSKQPLVTREGQVTARGVLLSTQDTRTGTEHAVSLLGGGDPPQPAPTHGGGVAVHGDFVYLADTDQVYVYRRSDIDNATWNAQTQRYEVAADHVIDMPTLPANDLDQVVSYDAGSCQDLRQPASYITVHGNYAYVGSWSPDGDGLSGSVMRFDIDPKTGALINPSDPIKAPDQSQGVTVVDGGRGLLFSSNHADNKLVYQPLSQNDADGFSASPADRKVFDDGRLIGSYVEEINIVGDELWVTYESGALVYRDQVKDPRDSIQRIPLSELGQDFPGA